MAKMTWSNCVDYAINACMNYVDGLGDLKDLLYIAFGDHPNFEGMSIADIRVNLLEELSYEVHNSEVIEESICLNIWNKNYYDMKRDSAFTKKEITDLKKIDREIPDFHEDSLYFTEDLEDGKWLKAFQALCYCLLEECESALNEGISNYSDADFRKAIAEVTHQTVRESINNKSWKYNNLLRN